MCLTQNTPSLLELRYSVVMAEGKKVLVLKSKFDALLDKMLRMPPLPMAEVKAKKKRLKGRGK